MKLTNSRPFLRHKVEKTGRFQLAESSVRERDISSDDGNAA